MKREIAEFVSKCLTCQPIKIEHQKPAGLLQPLSIPEWKWERITMDFVIGLPRTQRGHDAIWVIVDRLTKSAHFIATNNTYSLERYAQLYVDEIVRLHGSPVHCIGQRSSLHFSILAEATRCYGHQITLQYYFPPTDRWPIRENHSDSRRYVESLCDGV